LELINPISMKTRKVDYHIHSYLSDGDLSPHEIVELCYVLHIDAFSITDHDSIGSVHRLKALSQQLPPSKLISGVELDCMYQNREIHLLGYDFDEDDADLNTHLKVTQQLRRKRIVEQIHKINEYYNRLVISENDIVNDEKETYMKPHIIQKLISLGFHAELPYESAYQTINKFLNELCTETEIIKIDILEAMKLIKNAGGICVLAHPAYYHAKGISLDSMFMKLKNACLDGVEVNYPYHYNSPDIFSPQEEQEIIHQLESMADEHQYLKTSGSDAHTKRQLIDSNNHG